ncbi:MAG TPA: hypothetical protein VF503_19590 [Sphingobium sp.]|uniref:hypothetical protein n=1 Tax=Sphingobium sp. TaxID=1912891 RepID=UPI002ED20308
MTSTPPDSLSIADIGRLDFRTSRSGDTATAALLKTLGLQYRYQPARLALGKSLGLKTQPSPIENYDGRTIRGETLFGTGVTGLGLWTSLIIEHAGEGQVSRRRLQELVAAHWARGANLLWDNLRKSDDPLLALAEQTTRMRG